MPFREHFIEKLAALDREGPDHEIDGLSDAKRAVLKLAKLQARRFAFDVFCRVSSAAGHRSAVTDEHFTS